MIRLPPSDDKTYPWPDIVWCSLGHGADVHEQSSRYKAARGGGNCPTRFSPSLLTKRAAVVATTHPVARARRATAARPVLGGERDGQSLGGFLTLCCHSERLVSASLRIDVCTIFKKLRAQYCR